MTEEMLRKQVETRYVSAEVAMQYLWTKHEATWPGPGRGHFTILEETELYRWLQACAPRFSPIETYPLKVCNGSV